MDEIYTKIQIYLMKKDKECETLRFLTSRTTPTNNAHVTDVCQTMKTILKDSTPSVDDQISVQHFKFLLLNTNFRAQEHLCEDIANGHLVDMCPPLSPYLFMEIIWALNFEDIMSTSIFYIPLDLCTEIINALRRSMEVDFQRGFNTMLKVVANCYKKLISMIYQNTQCLEEEESLKYFAGSIQELISMLGSFQSRKIEGLSQMLKYERSGWVLIRILNTVKECMNTKRAANLPPIFNEESDKLYKISFARNFTVRLDPEVVQDAVNNVSKSLIDLLLDNVKKIDCYVYMGWAELDYKDDTSMSMQRAIGLSCYNFVEYLEAEESPEEYSHLVECLRQLSSKPDAPFSMSLQELCSEVDKGNKECLKKLIKKFEDWDSTAVLCLDKNDSIIDKSECLSLLNSVVKFLDLNTEVELRVEVYNMAMKILMGQKLVDLVEIVVEFALIHSASRALESMNFEPDLKSYVNQGLPLCSSKSSLRIILYFAIQNPRQVLKTLIRAAIGYPEHANSMILPEDLCKLSPIMRIRDSNNISLLSNSMRAIITENITWNGKKFLDLTRVLLNRNLLSPDELLNDIFIPVLRNDIILPNFQSILTCIRTIKDNLTRKMRRQELLYVLALQMSSLRRKNDLPINSREEMMNLLTRIIQHFSKLQNNSPANNDTDLFIERLEASLEPLDRIYFARQWGWIRDDISLDHVLQDHKRRCFYIMNESKLSERHCADIDRFLEEHGLETVDFLQHLILRCTEFEYLMFAKEALIVHWNCFGWENELDAYAQFSLATIKACCNSLRSIDASDSLTFSTQKFVSLIKSLAKLTSWFISIDIMTDYEFVHKSLVAAMMTVDLNTTLSPDLLNLYKEFKEILNLQTGSIYSYEMVTELVLKVEEFGDQCLRQCSQPDANIDVSSLQFPFNSTLISICLGWPLDENDLLLSKIDKKLYSKR